MSIYEYECTRCKDVTEIIHRHDLVFDYTIVCEKCLENYGTYEPIKRIISSGGFNFKGGKPT